MNKKMKTLLLAVVTVILTASMSMCMFACDGGAGGGGAAATAKDNYTAAVTSWDSATGAKSVKDTLDISVEVPLGSMVVAIELDAEVERKYKGAEVDEISGAINSAKVTGLSGILPTLGNLGLDLNKLIKNSNKDLSGSYMAGETEVKFTVYNMKSDSSIGAKVVEFSGIDYEGNPIDGKELFVFNGTARPTTVAAMSDVIGDDITEDQFKANFSDYTQILDASSNIALGSASKPIAQGSITKDGTKYVLEGSLSALGFTLSTDDLDDDVTLAVADVDWTLQNFGVTVDFDRFGLFDYQNGTFVADGTAGVKCTFDTMGCLSWLLDQLYKAVGDLSAGTLDSKIDAFGEKFFDDYSATAVGNILDIIRDGIDIFMPILSDKSNGTAKDAVANLIKFEKPTATMAIAGGKITTVGMTVEGTVTIEKALVTDVIAGIGTLDDSIDGFTFNPDAELFAGLSINGIVGLASGFLFPNDADCVISITIENNGTYTY